MEHSLTSPPSMPNTKASPATKRQGLIKNENAEPISKAIKYCKIYNYIQFFHKNILSHKMYSGLLLPGRQNKCTFHYFSS